MLRLRQGREDDPLQALHLAAPGSRDRYHLAKGVTGGQLLQVGQQAGLVLDRIDLVDHGDGSHSRLGHCRQGLGIFFGPAQGLHHEEGKVDVHHSRTSGPVQIAVQRAVAALVDTRRIHKDHLPPLPGLDADHGVPGGLGLVGGDDQLLAEDTIEQGGLADVRPADDGHGPAVIRHEVQPPGAAGVWLRPVVRPGAGCCRRPRPRCRRPGGGRRPERLGCAGSRRLR